MLSGGIWRCSTIVGLSNPMVDDILTICIYCSLFWFPFFKDFAAQLLLPNKYTGYVYLLDSNNLVRWKGSGKATDEELAVLVKCAKDLLKNE
jgi:hypothetical protein